MLLIEILSNDVTKFIPINFQFGSHLLKKYHEIPPNLRNQLHLIESAETWPHEQRLFNSKRINGV